jgi:hypothetical protein
MSSENQQKMSTETTNTVAPKAVALPEVLIQFIIFYDFKTVSNEFGTQN